MAKGPQWPREACVVITDPLLDPFHLRKGQRRKRKVGGAGRGHHFTGAFTFVFWSMVSARACLQQREGPTKNAERSPGS